MSEIERSNIENTPEVELLEIVMEEDPLPNNSSPPPPPSQHSLHHALSSHIQGKVQVILFFFLFYLFDLFKLLLKIVIFYRNYTFLCNKTH